MRKLCNFTLPKPFTVLSTNGLKRNNYRKYIIYPDLSKFKQACLGCRYLRRENKHYKCLINTPDFMLRFYGVDKSLGKGVYISLGTIPLDLKPRPLAMRIEAFLRKHGQKSDVGGLKTIKDSLSDSKERLGGLEDLKGFPPQGNRVKIPLSGDSGK